MGGLIRIRHTHYTNKREGQFYHFTAGIEENRAVQPWRDFLL